MSEIISGLLMLAVVGVMLWCIWRSDEFQE